MISHVPVAERTPAVTLIADQHVLADRVYSAMRRAILSLELEPGTQLVEREFALKFGVSKSPVRDALQRLAGEGLVTQSPYRGMSVLSVDTDLADEIYALREILEKAAVLIATPRLTREDVAEARRYLAQSLEAISIDDRPAVAEHNREFHLVFSRTSGNRPLHEAISRLQDRVRIVSLQGWRRHTSMSAEANQHLAILEAAAAGQQDRAARMMSAHIHSFRIAYRNAVLGRTSQAAARRS